MAEFLRIRCPFCQSMPNLPQLEKAEDAPADVRVFLVKMGGKLVVAKEEGEYKKKGRGKAPGIMKYVDVTKNEPEVVEQFKKYFAERAVKFAEQAGLIEGGKE